MDRTKPDGTDAKLSDQSDPSLDETVPSSDFGPSSLTQATVTPGARAETDVVLERGAAVGRYVVIDRLGSGAMGVVVLAFDPTLDRKVALKLVRLDHTGTTAGLQRLLREAQAMARLSHPNVVTVFEVGTFEERVFLAMEYVPGSTLGDWLAVKKRTRREIVTAFLAAGQGVAAAHRAGIVHRDFKPANVLVAQDGRVRVADFGLATATLGRAPTPPPIEGVGLDSQEMAMTKTGAVLGTPAYMAPEQHRGEPADARADQFAFCAALYEALYGELPFAGKTYVTYAENVLAGNLRDAPRGSDVPARLRRALVRGLALDPADRFRDFEPLLAELASRSAPEASVWSRWSSRSSHEAPRPPIRVRRRISRSPGCGPRPTAVHSSGASAFRAARGRPARSLTQLACSISGCCRCTPRGETRAWPRR